MSLKIRLQRLGRKDKPFYRIVTMEEHSKRNGRYIAKLGYVNPGNKKNEVKLDRQAYENWLAKGARPSEGLRKILDNQ